MAQVDSHDAVLDAERRGELLMAFDLADRALAEHPDDLWVKHRAVLMLARAGSTGEASRRFAEYGLGDIEDEDIAALEARIAKDEAIAAGGDLTRAAELYEAIFRHTGGYYPAVNAATLRMLDGETERAVTLAGDARKALRRSGDESYYAAATEAEVALILGEHDGAVEALLRARELNHDDYSALATTRRQLRLLIEATGGPDDLLEPLSGPCVLHFCGHRIGAARFPFDDEAEVTERIVEELGRLSPGFGYGALASGADIICAEQLLKRGAELHVVLPFDRDEFVIASVADGGEEWIARFESCFAAATTVTYATNDAFLGDDVLFSYASELAMGMVLQRAAWLDAGAVQLAVWDGLPSALRAGTAVDVARWAATGRRTNVVRPPHTRPPAPGPPAEPGGDGVERVVRSLIFSDVAGFSKLTDEELPRFNEIVLGPLGRVLNRYEAEVDYRNTWGDAVYAVLRDPNTAAACAMALQATMKEVRLPRHKLPAHLALRLGAHIGPVFPTQDPVIGGDAFMGSHVSRTARIEPVTPPGEVYVTDAFAAALALADSEYSCDYVGHMPAAKGYGYLRMYRLRAPVPAALRAMNRGSRSPA
jgi:class 3 adenylate cyclase/tetratricopeptide (TPR) repeat protein